VPAITVINHGAFIAVTVPDGVAKVVYIVAGSNHTAALTG